MSSVEAATTARCPRCSFVTDLNAIVVDGDDWIARGEITLLPGLRPS